MKKAIFTSFAHGLRWTLALAMIALTGVRVSAQCSLVCNNLVQVSLDQSCEAEILPDMIAEGGGCPNGDLHVQARINNAWVPASGNFVATAAHINQTLQVRVRDANTGNFCWGMLKIEDKLAPQITCTNLTIPCAVSNYAPSYLKNVLGFNAAEPTVVENCGNFTLSYTDTWVDLTCNQTIHGLSNISGYIQRFWSVIDQSGNVNNCTQFIYLERKNLTDITMPADVTISCPSGANVDPAVSGAPSFMVNDVTISLFPQNTECEFNVAYQDQLLPICDGTFKILRTWTLYDWCKPTNQNSANPNPLYYIQVIKIEDSDGPIINCPEDITVNTNSNDCVRHLDLPDVIVADGCSRIKSAVAQWFVNGQGFTLNGSITSFPGNNFWNPDTLAAFGIAQNLPLGTTTMTYIITDDCGNSSTCQFNITVADETPPTVACDEFTKVALGIDGMALINATTFDDGSFDNCSPNVYFKVRRMDSNDCQTNSQFHDQVKFCCEDIGQTITVILRVYDIQPPAGSVSLSFGEDNANDCMVQVLVEDKIKPNCVSPANVTVSCENFDPSLWAYGKAQVSDNCCLDDTKVYQGQIGLTHTANFSQFDTVCNRGTITRTFRAFDCDGNSSQCTQRVLVNYNQNYFIRFPDDVLVTTCDGTPNFGAPTFFGEDCELLGVSHVDEVFTVVPDACYKIERTWTILNWCQYNPNGTCTTVPNPEPNININAPQNRPGPIVSACGTPASWAPTVVAIGPGQPPTNYCSFWSANANCYKYKQIIKVIDNTAPTIVGDCPASPVEFCDLTANNPNLWNDMSWWDPIIGSHDLCEGPTDLQITATDACSGADIDISYLLFLDLDGDGTMETVINSNTPPGFNVVNFGNANNPNYTGGTPRPFDQRPVPSNQKYRFNIDITRSGDNATAFVVWDWQTQQANLNDNVKQGVVPELPYGTHKIKWFISDKCGNNRECEYTFIVKDCKKPTVVCLNGLSVNIMQTGMISMWATDFLKETFDNCTPADQIKIGIRRSGAGTGFPFAPNGVDGIQEVSFTCADLGTQLVELWAIDKAGNADFCETYLLVQDNMGVCAPPGDKASVSGFLKTEDDNPLEGAMVDLQGQHPNLPPVSMSQMSDVQGGYVFSSAVPMSGSFTVTPEFDHNHLNGVTTYDLVLINRHILGQELIDSPYKLIAADANKSGTITTFDIVEIRKMILGIYNELPNNTSWRFVEKAFVFQNPQNPWDPNVPAFKEHIAVDNVQANYWGKDFVAIKIGDINDSAVPNALAPADDRSAGAYFFDTDNREVKTGEIFDVRIKGAEKALGYQFTLNFKGLELVELIPGEGMKTDNFAVFAQAITTSVDGEANEFTLRFRATRNGSLSELLKVSSAITKAEAYSPAGQRLDVALRFNGQTLVNGPAFELFQNTPNPVSAQTQITFNLPQAGEATLTISTVDGRIVKRITADYPQGLNTVTLSRNDLESGVLFYQIEAFNQSAVKRMIVIESK